MTSADRNWRILTLSAVGLFAAFRLPELTRYALWYDELFSITLAQMDWGELMRAAIHDRTNPPLFYALLKVWIGIGGTSVAWVRLLPCLASIAVAWPLSSLARRTFASNFAAGAVTLAVAAASPLVVFLANELRGYSLFLLLGTTSMLVFTRLVAPGGGSRQHILALGVINTLLVYVHYFGWLLVAAEVGAGVFLYRRALRPLMISSFAVGMAFLPWAIAVLLGARDAAAPLSNVSWISQPGFAAMSGFYDALVARVLTPDLAWLGAVVMLVPLGVLAIVVRHPASVSTRRFAAELAWFAAFPVGVIFVAGLIFGRSAFVPRYLILAAPAWWMLIGLALTGPYSPLSGRKPAWVVAGLFCGFTMACGALRELRGGEKVPWDRLVAQMAAGTPPDGEPVIYSLEPFTALPLAYYAAESTPRLRVTLVGSLPASTVVSPAGWLVVRARDATRAAATGFIARTDNGRLEPRDSAIVGDQRIIVYRIAPQPR